MSQDLRSYLQRLESERPKDLLRIKKKVALDQEPMALVRRLEESGRHPALLFERAGESGMPVLVNLHATEERLALALGVDATEVRRAYMERLARPHDPKTVDDGPVQEIVRSGQDVDLGELPILTPFAQCPAPYLSGAIVVAKDPDTGCANLSYNRVMVRGRRSATFHPAPGLHLDAILRKFAARHEPCPVAVIVGCHPAFALGLLAKVPYGVDEYTCAGGMFGEPVRLVRGRTVPLEVPAEAEMVLEGFAHPELLEPEGPYGEFTGYALPGDLRPLIEFSALTRRRDAIYQDIAAGCREHLLLGKLPKEASLEQRLRAGHPCVRRVHLPLSGCGRFHLVVSVAGHRPADVRRVIVAAFALDHFLKHVFVVDDDVEVASDRETLWALATCFQGGRDSLTIERMPGTDLDPSGEPGGVGAKVGFDCTRKGNGFPPRHRVTKQAWERMDPAHWIGAPA